MYNLIVFALCCFAVGFITGFATVITVILKVVKSLGKRRKPKH